MEKALNIVKRSLAALDRLEDSGVPIGLIRADLSTVADRLEEKISAANDDCRAKCERCGVQFHRGDMAATFMVRDSDGELRNGYLCMACVEVSVEKLKRKVDAMVDRYGLKPMKAHASFESEGHQ
ncbi:hypothetical protein C4J81_15480 [Deltaproteobacteria bacterium Smac51]|nr:hypothetical protein C4J81_15480 [Deltaproteobacteria bacterium Smac51]